MRAARSPNDKPKASMAVATTTSSSYPDLRTLNENDESQSITLRKRKKPEHEQEFKEEITKIHTEINTMNTQFTELITNFRNDIFASIEKLSKTQSDNMSQIRQDLSDLRTDLSSINQRADKLTTEQQQLKSDLTQLASKSDITEQKLKQIETQMSSLKTEPTSMFKQEELLHEMRERHDRQKNIIIAGVLELEDSNKANQENLEKQQIQKLLKPIYGDSNCPNITKCLRLGKYNASKNRLIKITLESQEIAQHILRNKDKITKSEIKIFSDQTPNQQKYLKELRTELQHRQENGETNISIKYSKGLPKIVSIPSKN